MPEIVGGLKIMSYEFTRSWGVEPASASGAGVIAAGDSSAGLAVGEYYAFSFGGVTFYGIISSVEAATERDTGQQWPFQMVDNRIRLQWALVFGQWNMEEDASLIHASDYPDFPVPGGHSGGAGDGVDFGSGLGSEPTIPVSDIVAGSATRGRIYGSIPPEQWASQIKCYAAAPVSAADMLDQAFKGALGGYQFTLSNHASQNKPVFNVDANNGMTLAALVAMVTEAQGLQVTLDGQKTLRWERRGGTLITPAGAHVTRNGSAMSAEPTKVRVVGDRVLLQSNNILLEPDWKPAWEAFISEPAWLAEVKRVTEAVADGAAGHAEIAARAREMTLRQYITLAGVDVEDYADYGRWQNVSRLNMEVWTYLNSIIYRSYRIPAASLLCGMPMRSWEIHENLLCAVTITGSGAEGTVIGYRLDPLPEFYPQASSYAIAQGQPLDLLSAADRDLVTRLRLKDLRTEWSEVSDFTLDPLNHSIHFASPVFTDGDPAEGKSILAFPNKGEAGWEDLSGSLDVNSDYLRVCVPNPDYVITAAPVRCSLTFRLGKFYKDFGTGAKWKPYTASSLAEHLLHPNGGSFSHSLIEPYDGVLRVPNVPEGLGEIRYDNGHNAREEAEEQAEGVIVRSGIEQSGSYTRYGVTGTSLTGATDRITISVPGREDGIREVVDFAKPRPTQGFVSSRDTSRRIQTEELYGGREDLRREVRQLRAISRLESGKNNRPRSKSHNNISDVFRHPFGSENHSTTTYPDPNSQWPEGRTTGEEDTPVTGWRAGDLLWLDDQGLPSRTGETFGGVVVSDSPKVAEGEESIPVKYVTVATDGTVPCACAPGLAASAALVATPGDWKCTAAGTYPIGMLGHHSPVPGSGDATIALVRLNAGGGGGSAVGPCNFADIIQYSDDSGSSSADLKTGVRGGNIKAGAQTWNMNEPYELDLSVDAEFPVWIRTPVTVNINSTGIATLSGIATSEQPVWEQGTSSSDNYPDTVIPAAFPTGSDASGVLITPIGYVRIVGGVASILAAGCGDITGTYCPGNLDHYRGHVADASS